MIAFITNNSGTIIIAGILVVVCALIIRSLIKKSKRGGCAGCAGCSCGEGCTSDSSDRAKETLINCLSPYTQMDLEHSTGKKRRDTGGITRLFAEAMRQIGGVYGGRVINHRFPNIDSRDF